MRFDASFKNRDFVFVVDISGFHLNCYYRIKVFNVAKDILEPDWRRARSLWSFSNFRFMRHASVAQMEDLQRLEFQKQQEWHEAEKEIPSFREALSKFRKLNPYHGISESMFKANHP